MDENTKITFAKNLSKYNFNSTLNIPFDNNVNIKSIVDINTFLFDQKIECGNGKAILSGKIGAKILYIDTDNLTNILTDSTGFNETIIDSSITTSTNINICDYNILNEIISTEGSLKINCNISINPIIYLNIPISNNMQFSDMIITRKNEIATNTISQFINTKFEYVSTIECKDKINKILSNNSYLTCEKITSNSGFAVVEGKMYTNLLFEVVQDDDTILKCVKDVSSFKQDVEIAGLTKEDELDLSFQLDKQNEEITTDLEDDENIISIKNTIKVCGTALKPIVVDLVDDVYSTSHDVETTKTQREFTKKAETFSIVETISNDINLLSDEPAIDEVVSNLNINSEITNTYIKEQTIFIEGIVTSNLIYIDENKELKNKQIETPFIINTKIQAISLGCVHTSLNIVDNKVKIKRGTIIETEYSLFIYTTKYEKENCEVVDNFTFGKALDFTKYDFQIFIAKPNETLWDLCKRIKIAPDEIHKHNSNLPMVMMGGERIVIKR